MCVCVCEAAQQLRTGGNIPTGKTSYLFSELKQDLFGFPQYAISRLLIDGDVNQKFGKIGDANLAELPV